VVQWFLSVDPLTSSYPWYTPYQFAGNKPIESIDLDGLEERHYALTFDKNQKPVLTFLNEKDLYYAEWTPTWGNWFKHTRHKSDEKRYIVHTGVWQQFFYDNAYGYGVEDFETTFNYSSEEAFKARAYQLTPDDVSSRTEAYYWGNKFAQGLGNISIEYRDNRPGEGIETVEPNTIGAKTKKGARIPITEVTEVGKGSATIDNFIPTEVDAQSLEYINKYAADIKNAEDWVGKGAWPHKPLRVVDVDGKKIILDGHHRYEAAKSAGFSGKIPYQSVPVSESGYTLEQLKGFIK